MKLILRNAITDWYFSKMVTIKRNGKSFLFIMIAGLFLLNYIWMNSTKSVNSVLMAYSSNDLILDVNPNSLQIPAILHQSWKTTELPAVSIKALTDRNSSDGDRLGLPITPLGSTNYGRMQKIASLYPSTFHGFSRLMMHYRIIFKELIPCDTCTCIITAGYM